VLAAIAVNALVLGALILSPVVVEPRIVLPGTKTYDVPVKKPPPPDQPKIEADPVNPQTLPPIYVPPAPLPPLRDDRDQVTTSNDGPVNPPPLFGGTGTDLGTGPIAGPTKDPPKVVDPPKPPVPVFASAKRDPKFASSFQPQYPAIMAAREIEGSVRVKILIGSNGRVRQAIIMQASDPAFGHATVKQALRAWRFIPATRDGAPVEEWQTLSVRFDME
jgi:periplasmic protein TonB